MEVIIRSFSACGISTVNPDEIHCTKPGNVTDQTREAILQFSPDIFYMLTWMLKLLSLKVAKMTQNPKMMTKKLNCNK